MLGGQILARMQRWNPEESVVEHVQNPSPKSWQRLPRFKLGIKPRGQRVFLPPCEVSTCFRLPLFPWLRQASAGSSEALLPPPSALLPPQYFNLTPIRIQTRGRLGRPQKSAGAARLASCPQPLAALGAPIHQVPPFVPERACHEKGARGGAVVHLAELNRRRAPCCRCFFSLSALLRPPFELNGITQLTYTGPEWEAKRPKNSQRNQ